MPFIEGKEGYENMPEKGFSKEYCTRFGKLAVDMGFINKNQLRWTMIAQLQNDLNNKSHKVIGHILFERGWITPRQIDLVLNQLFGRKGTERAEESIHAIVSVPQRLEERWMEKRS